MTIASALTALSQDITAARTAITTKGGTVTANGGSSQLATDIATIPSGGSSGRYQLHDRVKSDSNVDVGMVSGFFLDANNTEYAVVCLNAQYRLASGVYCSDKTATITNLPAYTNLTLWSATETATFNTQKILDYAASKSATSTACTHCRNKYFTVRGTRYYGQLPNIQELVDIYRSRIFINNGDPTASSYSSLIVPTNKRTWSSSQYSIANAWTANANGAVGADAKTTQYFVIPVLEIPNAV